MKSRFFLIVCAVILMLFRAFPEEVSAAELVISGETVWNENFLIKDRVTVESGAKLIIEKGVVIEFQNGGNLYVKGELAVRGEVSAPVVFTRKKPKAGEARWAYYMYTETSSRIVIENAIMRQGGGYFEGGSQMPAIRIKGEAEINNSLITDNTWAIEVRGDGKLKMRNCDIYGNNSTWGLQVVGDTALADVGGNFWGDDTGPHHASLNKEGGGESIIGRNISFSSWQRKGRMPVVLVPGFGASINFKRLLADQDGGTWRLFPPKGSVADLKKSLEDSGYTEGKDLFVGYYDWRSKIEKSSIEDLWPIINKAKEETGYREVVLVAHSFGGLVSRAYIQSENYLYDVRSLTTLGTPHRGASKIYVFIEGGMLPVDWDPSLYLYLWYEKQISGQADLGYIKDKIPSAYQLMPTYDFIRLTYSNELVRHWTMNYYNKALDDLNKSVSVLAERTRAKFIYSSGFPTVDEISAEPRLPGATPYWSDGIPDPLIPLALSAEGDGTVPVKSASLDQPNILSASVSASHFDLPIAAWQEIEGTLGRELGASTQTIPDTPYNYVVFCFASPIEVEIRDALGHRLSEEIREIAGYFWQDEAEGKKMAIIYKPESEYLVSVKGINPGNYRILALSYNANNAPAYYYQEVSGDIESAKSRSYTVTREVDSLTKRESAISISENLLSPYIDIIQIIKTAYQKQELVRWDARQDLLMKVLRSYDYSERGDRINEGLILEDIKVILEELHAGAKISDAAQKAIAEKISQIHS